MELRCRRLPGSSSTAYLSLVQVLGRGDGDITATRCWINWGLIDPRNGFSPPLCLWLLLVIQNWRRHL